MHPKLVIILLNKERKWERVGHVFGNSHTKKRGWGSESLQHMGGKWHLGFALWAGEQEINTLRTRGRPFLKLASSFSCYFGQSRDDCPYCISVLLVVVLSAAWLCFNGRVCMHNITQLGGETELWCNSEVMSYTVYWGGLRSLIYEHTSLDFLWLEVCHARLFSGSLPLPVDHSVWNSTIRR